MMVEAVVQVVAARVDLVERLALQAPPVLLLFLRFRLPLRRLPVLPHRKCSRACTFTCSTAKRRTQHRYRRLLPQGASADSVPAVRVRLLLPLPHPLCLQLLQVAVAANNNLGNPHTNSGLE